MQKQQQVNQDNNNILMMSFRSISQQKHQRNNHDKQLQERDLSDFNPVDEQDSDIITPNRNKFKFISTNDYVPQVQPYSTRNQLIPQQDFNYIDKTMNIGDQTQIVTKLQDKNQELIRNISDLSQKVEDLIKINLIKFKEEASQQPQNLSKNVQNKQQQDIQELKDMFNLLLKQINQQNSKQDSFLNNNQLPEIGNQTFGNKNQNVNGQSFRFQESIRNKTFDDTLQSTQNQNYSPLKYMKINPYQNVQPGLNQIQRKNSGGNFSSQTLSRQLSREEIKLQNKQSLNNTIEKSQQFLDKDFSDQPGLIQFQRQIHDLLLQLKEKEKMTQWYQIKLRDYIEPSKTNQKIMRYINIANRDQRQIVGLGQLYSGSLNKFGRGSGFNNIQNTAAYMRKKELNDMYSPSRRRQVNQVQIIERDPIYDYKSIFTNIDNQHGNYIDPHDYGGPRRQIIKSSTLRKGIGNQTQMGGGLPQKFQKLRDNSHTPNLNQTDNNLQATSKNKNQQNQLLNPSSNTRSKSQISVNFSNNSRNNNGFVYDDKANQFIPDIKNVPSNGLSNSLSPIKIQTYTTINTTPTEMHTRRFSLIQMTSNLFYTQKLLLT
eukprot:403368133